jgi:CheY-like chemotaxis protein
MSFARESMDAAVELAQKSKKWPVVVPDADRECVLRRARRCARVLNGAQALWVDDCPDNNVNEIRMFRQLQVAIDVATTTEAALDIVKTKEYDLVLSDMARGNQADAGLDFLQQLRRVGKTTPVIFYIGTVDPTKGIPPQAFGLTNRPDELLHLTIDALERKRA